MASGSSSPRTKSKFFSKVRHSKLDNSKGGNNQTVDDEKDKVCDHVEGKHSKNKNKGFIKCLSFFRWYNISV